MFKTLNTRFIVYTTLYTALLVLLLYGVQRYVAPTLYVRSVLQNEAELALEVATIKTSPSQLSILNARTSSEIILFNAQGQVIFGTEAPLIPLDVVTSFQEGTWHRFTRSQTQTFLEFYYVDESTIILLKSPFAPIISNISFLNQFYIMIGFLALLLAVPLSYFFARSFTNPVVKINHLAKQFKNLSLDATLDLNRGDELGELETSLKTMAATLKQTFEDLQTELQKEKALDQIQKDFVARVSHELKTPLAIIKNSVETLFDHVKTVLPMDLKTMIDEEIDHMVSLSHDLIDLSQLESGRFKIHPQPINLTDLTQEILWTYQDAPIHLNMQSALNLTLDPIRMKQVFNNLIQNSLYHRQNKSPITIDIDSKNLTWAITNKIDLPVENLNAIFKPFYKGQEKTPGSGLGLAIVESILKAHKASINASQKEGMITFRIQFAPEKTKH
jgi:two-component system, OmpR family, sensor histidine kinase VanS